VSENSTLFMTLLAAFKALLHRYSGQDDICVGTPVAGRNLIETENIIGFFVNTLVLRSQFSNEQSFRRLITIQREVAVNAYLHGDVPFENIVQGVQLERDLSHSPLFQAMFVLQPRRSQAPSLPNLSLTLLEIDTGTAKFDLLLSMEETEDGLRGRIEYNTDLFDRSTIDRLICHYESLLRAVILDADRPIFSLPLLTPAEQLLLLEWNDTAKEFDRLRTIGELFEEQVQRTPHAVAVARNDRSLTYCELDARANRLASYLIERGVGPEALVGVFMSRSEELPMAILSVLKAGAAYVPIDPAYPAERIAFMLEDSNASVVLTERFLAAQLEANGKEVIKVDDQWEEMSRYSVKSPKSGVTGENLAYVIYTSGSTGKPKGVSIQHRSAVALIEWARDSYQAESFSQVLATTSICFDLSVFEIMAPLSVGGTVVMADNALELVESGVGRQISLINTVPSAMKEIISLARIPESVKVVNLAGEPLHKKLVEEIYRQSGVEQVWNLYGPTEDTTYSTSELVSRTGGEVTIGKPIANAEIQIVDDHLQAALLGVVGEIYISGEGLARGYLNRRELTAERFVPNPFSRRGGERMYRTGDLGRYRGDGSIEYVGRRDHQVKVRGYRVELGEVEARLSELEGVREAAVVVGESEGGEKQLVGYVVAAVEVSESEVKRRLKEALPEYMVVRRVVKLEEMPRLPNGKVDRRELEKRRADSDGAGARRGIGEKRRAGNAIEEEIAKIWREVLEVEEIGVDEDFFELGGHSLLAIRLIVKLRSSFQVELPLRTLFEDATVAGIARGITKAGGVQVKAKDSAITAAPREQFVARNILSASELSGIPIDGRRS